jgi:hypothetical protein
MTQPIYTTSALPHMSARGPTLVLDFKNKCLPYSTILRIHDFVQLHRSELEGFGNQEASDTFLLYDIQCRVKHRTDIFFSTPSNLFLVHAYVNTLPEPLEKKMIIKLFDDSIALRITLDMQEGLPTFLPHPSFRKLTRETANSIVKLMS